MLISPPTDAEAQALRDWGDFVHINHIVEAGIPGFTMITPYENATKGDPRYMHFYEFDDPDAEVTFKRMRPLVEAQLGPWGSPECEALGRPPRAADHVRELVRARRRADAPDGRPRRAAVLRRRLRAARVPRVRRHPGRRRRRSSSSCAPARTRRARRTSSRGSSSSCATPHAQKVIHDLTEAAWITAGRAFSETRLPPELLKEVDEGIAGGGYRTAPVLVVVCADLDRGLPATAGSSIFPCVQNMLLAAERARARLGAHHARRAQPTDELRALLALPDHVVPKAIVPLGVPGPRRSARPGATR